MFDNTYGMGEPANSFLSGAGIVVIILTVLLFLLIVAGVILIVISNCKIFKKAGEKWWKGLIPLYSSWVETRITGLAWWWFPIFVGFTALMGVNEQMNSVIYMGVVLISFNYNYNLAIKFGKSNGFAVFNTILPIIGLPILAFGSAKYNKDAKVDKNGIFSIKNM